MVEGSATWRTRWELLALVGPLWVATRAQNLVAVAAFSVSPCVPAAAPRRRDNAPIAAPCSTHRQFSHSHSQFFSAAPTGVTGLPPGTPGKSAGDYQTLMGCGIGSGSSCPLPAPHHGHGHGSGMPQIEPCQCQMDPSQGGRSCCSSQNLNPWRWRHGPWWVWRCPLTRSPWQCP